MKFIERLLSSIHTHSSSLCVGLDTRYDKIPDNYKTGTIADSIFSFNKQLVDVTHDVASVYKMNVAFYGGFGEEGLAGLKKTNEYLKSTYPEIPLLADCKRSEMGESVKMVKQEIFDWLQFDCVMVTPWFGFDTVRDYLDDESHGVCVYVHDSNPTAAEFQDLELKDGRKVYEAVTEQIAKVWNANGNVWVEAGLTYPTELKRVREIIGEDMPMLTAGVGTQGGDLNNLKGLFGTDGERLLVNSSRGIIWAGIGKQDYFEAVRVAATALATTLKTVSTS